MQEMPADIGNGAMNERSFVTSNHGKLTLRLGDFLKRLLLDPMADQRMQEADRLARSVECGPLRFTVEEECIRTEEDGE